MKKKILFSFIFIMLLIPSVVNASEYDPYGIWINEIKVTEDNKDDVLGDLDGNKKSVVFIKETSTSKAKLILDNALLERDDIGYNGSKYGIYSDLSNLIIELKGDNQIGTEPLEHYDPSKESQPDFGTYLQTIKENYPSFSSGFLTYNTNVTFTGDGSLTIYDSDMGIYASDVTFDKNFSGKLTIHDEAFPDDLPPMCGINSKGNIIIENGNFEIYSYNSVGMSALNELIIKNANIKTKTYNHSLEGQEKLEIADTLELINGKVIYDDASLLEIISTTENNGFITIKPKKIYATINYEMNGYGKSIPSETKETNEKFTKPEDPIDENYQFDGWYIDNDYSKEYDFNLPATKNISVYAKWTRKNKKYIVEDLKGNSITFTKESGHSYIFMIEDYLTLNDEGLGKLGTSRKQLSETVEKIKKSSNPKEELLALFEINLYDENNNQIHNGPFDIKLLFSKTNKKYDNYKLYYIDEEGNLSNKEVYKLSKIDEYLSTRVEHFSKYALFGEIDEKNPGTGDNIIIYLITGVISILGITATGLYLKKKTK